MSGLENKKLVSKEEAISLGLETYFTGIPCRKGHVCEIRITQRRKWIGGECVECRKIRSQSRHERDKRVVLDALEKNNNKKIDLESVDEPFLITRKEAQSVGFNRYFLGKKCVNGHLSWRKIYGGCVDCILENKRNRYTTEKFHEDRLKNPLKILFYSAKSRAAHRKMEFNITLEDLVLGKECPSCFREFDFSPCNRKQQRDRCPSLDRTDSSLGYIKGNVGIICWTCNKAKLNSDSFTLRMVADYIDRKMAQDGRTYAKTDAQDQYRMIQKEKIPTMMRMEFNA